VRTLDSALASTSTELRIIHTVKKLWGIYLFA
jgi:hypothetical protein